MEMSESLIDPDLTALNTLLTCFARSQQVPGAEPYEAGYMKDLAVGICRRIGLKPNAITVKCILTFYLDEMKANG